MEKVGDKLKHQATLDAQQLQEANELEQTAAKNLEIFSGRISELEEQVLFQRQSNSEALEQVSPI